MILEQFYLGCLAQASYLLADEKSRSAVIVDPRRDVDLYLEEARKRKLRIDYVLLTHFHADFVAGHLELRERAGASIGLSARAEAAFDFTPLNEDHPLVVGPDLRLEFLLTPGHTPESMCIVVRDTSAGGDRVHAVLTGDTLFIGDVGRPDLMASAGVPATDLAGQLYDSLHQKLLTLPDETLLYPGHGAGSLCGKGLGSETVSTLGKQRTMNYALQARTREEFIDLVTAHQPEPPAYFYHDAALNQGKRPTLEDALQSALNPLELETFLTRSAEGAQILDVREAAAHAGAHLKGSINIGLEGKFAPWAGAVLDLESPILIVAEPGQEREASIRLGRIGFDNVAGYLEGGMKSLQGHPDLLEEGRRMEATTLSERLEGSSAPPVLDVRGPAERSHCHIQGSTSIPLNQLLRRLDEVPSAPDLVVHCASGYRSATAASLLRRAGFEGVTDLVGGIAAWKALGLPLVSEEVPSCR